MRLLVSVVNSEEVPAALAGGADIIDIKNPEEGSLGAAPPWTIRTIIEEVDSRRETSCAIGDLPYLPGTASLAAAGAAAIRPDYVKLGLLGTRNATEARAVLSAAVEAVHSTSPGVKVIGCGYGDWDRVGSVSPLALPQLAAEVGADGVLIDTIGKKGLSLFDYLPVQDLKEFVSGARERGLVSALAGSLRGSHATKLKECSPDVVGIRGAACSKGDRRKGTLTAENIQAFRSAII
jgi:uncharacterized protein (UPF0264 family)